MNNYDELRQAAEMAAAFYAGDRWQFGQNGNANVVAFGGDDVRPVAHAVTDAARNLIAACDPETILALLDENEALREFAKAVIRYAGNNGDDYLADKARAALGDAS